MNKSKAAMVVLRLFLAYSALLIAGCATVTRCPLGDKVCINVAKHCQDLYFELEKERKVAFDLSIPAVGGVKLSAEEKQLVSDDYIAMRGMAYFSCAAFYRGDISHKEYVDTLFPIAALAESIARYLGNTSGADKIRSIVTDASTLEQVKEQHITYEEFYSSASLVEFRTVLQESGVVRAQELILAILDQYFYPDVSVSTGRFEQRVEYDRLRRILAQAATASADGLQLQGLLVDAIDARLRFFETREGLPTGAGFEGIAPGHKDVTSLHDVVASRFIAANGLQFQLSTEDRVWVDSVCERFGPFRYRVIGALYIGFKRDDKITDTYAQAFERIFAKCGFEFVNPVYVAPTRDPKFAPQGDGGYPAGGTGVGVFIFPTQEKQ